MRTVPAALATSLAQTESTLAYICQITRIDGTAVRLTTSVGDVTFGGNSYLGDTGFSITSVTFRTGGQAPSMDVKIPVRASGPVTYEDVSAGLYDGAEIEVRIIDYTAPASGGMVVFIGYISQAVLKDNGDCEFTIGGIISRLREIAVERYSRECAANLGDDRCKVNLTGGGFTKTGSVAAAGTDVSFSISVTEPRAVDGWFDNGVIKFTSGANSGLGYDIRSWKSSGSVVSLWVPLLKAVSPGDTFTISPGCDKTLASCKNKFNNVFNFQGFPFLPTNLDLSKIGQAYEVVDNITDDNSGGGGGGGGSGGGIETDIGLDGDELENPVIVFEFREVSRKTHTIRVYSTANRANWVDVQVIDAVEMVGNDGNYYRYYYDN